MAKSLHYTLHRTGENLGIVFVGGAGVLVGSESPGQYRQACEQGWLNEAVN